MEHRFLVAPADAVPAWVRHVLTGVAIFLALAGVAAAFRVNPSSAHNQPKSIGENLVLPPTIPAPPTTIAEKFFAADARFRATFPAQPMRSTQTFTVPPISFDVTMYGVDMGTEAYMIATYPLSPGFRYDLEGAITDAMAVNIDGTITSKKLRTFQGYPAVEAVISADDGAMRVMLVRAPDRLVAVIYGGEDRRSPKYAAFRDSVEIL